MSRDNVIPFRPRPPSEAELAVYDMITRSWHPDMRQLMLPEHFRQRAEEDPTKNK